MRILLTSVGTRNKLVRYFKSELADTGAVFAADCSQDAPALYEADHVCLVPTISDNRYVPALLQICNENKISAVLSLINPELPLLAEVKADFRKHGIICVVSDASVLDTCIDKYKLNGFLIEHGFPSGLVFIERPALKEAFSSGKMHFPIMIKRRRGAASVALQQVDSWPELEVVAAKGGEDLIYQEFLDGQEYGLDLYVDMITHKMVSAVPYRKIRMRAGESEKVTTVENERLIDLGRNVVEKLGIIGPCNIDCIDTRKGFVVIDVNPRFGGGYPFTHECGANFVKMIINNLEGRTNQDQIGNYLKGKYLYKYYEISIRDLENEHQDRQVREYGNNL